MSRGMRILGMATGRSEDHGLSVPDISVRTSVIEQATEIVPASCETNEDFVHGHSNSVGFSTALPGMLELVDIELETEITSAPIETDNDSLHGYSNSVQDISPDVSEYVPSDSESSTSEEDCLPSGNSALEGMEEFPESTSKPRKRKRQPDKWLRNVKKTLKAHGQEYVGARGIRKRKAEMRPPCKSSCIRKCQISENKRLGVFENYWGLGNYERQRDFINNNTDKVETKTKTTSSRSRRQFSCVFYLPLDGVRVRVCKTMFLNTLGIKKGVVDIALKKRSSVNMSFSDRRGRHVKKVVSPEVKNGIKRHIESFPVVASHYCRSDSERKYLKKDSARNEKRKDKEQAGDSKERIVSINFDLQQVLVTPSDPTNNQLFYKTRLSTYNFTIYNVVSKEGRCFMWHESEGGRGSCEIASCLFQYFQSLPENVKEVRCFSDRCGGQNLNQFVVGMCMYAMTILKLESVDLKFLTCGHSEMECDSMHSAITTEFKRVGKAYWPGDWKTIARSARKKGDKPYTVVDNLQFNDWKSFVNTNLNIRKKDTVGQPILWQKISWIRIEASLPNYFKFKESFDDEEFRVVDCNTNTRPSSHQPLLALYKRPRCIAKTKYDSLMSLFHCKPPAVSKDYYNFYNNLPHSLSTRDD
nr:unnamed protein product [Callosobruchus chinensis]